MNTTLNRYFTDLSIPFHMSISNHCRLTITIIPTASFFAGHVSSVCLLAFMFHGVINDNKKMFEIWNTNFNCFLLQGNHQIYLSLWILASFPAGHYMFKVNNRNTTTRCKICSNLTMQTPE